MKIRFREPKSEGPSLRKPKDAVKKLDTVRQKYKKMKLATIILSSSWVIAGIIYLINNLL